MDELREEICAALKARVCVRTPADGAGGSEVKTDAEWVLHAQAGCRGQE